MGLRTTFLAPQRGTEGNRDMSTVGGSPSSALLGRSEDRAKRVVDIYHKRPINIDMNQHIS